MPKRKALGKRVGWARLDSNQGATDYESAALTAELRARGTLTVAPPPAAERAPGLDLRALFGSPAQEGAS